MMANKKPANFSWIIKQLLAGCAFPATTANLQYLVDHGVRHLVTLTTFRPPVHVVPSELRHTIIPVEEFDAPSLQQLEDFVSIVHQAKQKNEAVAVHCHWGRGRTGTMLAAYLIKDQHVTPRAAITKVRQCRPYSIETDEQEGILFEYAEYLNHQKPH